MKLVSLLLIFMISFTATSGSRKDEIVQKLGPYSYEVNYFDQKLFDDLEFDYQLVERQKIDSKYLDSYRRYQAYALKQQLEPKRYPASIPSEDSYTLFRYSVPQSVGLIAFKRGELKASCEKVVDAAKKLGASSISYYHPVHFAGGSSSNYKMPIEAKYGKHWRYESGLNFTKKEFQDCMNLISESGIKLHYIPHLESISSLIDHNDESEWRLLSGIPIDDEYFQHSFAPLINYLKNYPKAFRDKGKLSFTLAAEIDPMVFSYARKISNGKKWLSSELLKLGITGQRYFINTNGDFNHGKELVVERGFECSEIVGLFKSIDGITPSMYGDKGHLHTDEKGKLSIKWTVKHYRERLTKQLLSLCPKNKEVINLVEKVPIGFGEFAILANSTQSYKDILNNAENELMFVQYWNHGQWDHLGIVTKGDDKLKKELLMIKADSSEAQSN